MNTSVFIILPSQEVPPKSQEHTQGQKASLEPSLWPHIPLKEAKQVLREMADAQPEAGKALAEHRYHDMAEANDTVKDSR